VKVPEVLGGGECPRCGGVGREGRLSNVACPLSLTPRLQRFLSPLPPHTAAAATPELRNRTTPAGFPSRSICPSRHPIDVLTEIRSALRIRARIWPFALAAVTRIR
jgi:hypothetical protein